MFICKLSLAHILESFNWYDSTDIIHGAATILHCMKKVQFLNFFNQVMIRTAFEICLIEIHMKLLVMIRSEVVVGRCYVKKVFTGAFLWILRNF